MSFAHSSSSDMRFKASGILLLAVAFLFFLSPSIQPALVNPSEVPWYSIPALALLSFTAYLFTTVSRIHIDKISAIIFILGIVPILLHAANTPVQKTLFHASFCLTLAGLWIWASNAPAKDIRNVFISYTAAAFIWCLLATFVWLGFTGGEMAHIGKWALTTMIGTKINGPFANGNVFGILAFCAWAITLWLWLRHKKGLHPLWYSAMIFFWVMGIASLSRGAWIAHSIVIAIVAILLLFNHKRRLIPFIAALVLALSLGSFLGSKGDPTLHSVSNQFETTQREGFGVRLLLWASVIEAWKESPWQGTGYGGLGAHYLTGQYHAFEKYRFQGHGLNMTTHAHNTPLHLLAEGGVTGAVLALLISAAVILALLANWKRMHATAWPATMIAGMLWLQGMVNISMTRPLPILLFCFALGVALRPLLRVHSDIFRIPKSAFAIPVAIGLIVLCAGTYTQTRDWYAYSVWYTTDKNSQELTVQLLSNDSTMPYFVGDTVRRALLTPSRHHMIPQLLPYVRTALNKLETPLLYKSIFFIQALNGEMDKACKTGHFILLNNWQVDDTRHYYRAACDGRLSSTLEIRD